MKHKILVFSLAVLLCLTVIGIARADNIPMANEPKNYPTVWTANVYNGSSATITSGRVVVWDFGTSDSTAAGGTAYDDMCPWVKTTSTADDIWTAGVLPLGRDLLHGAYGAIIIRGPAVVWNANTACTVNTVVSVGSSSQAYDESADSTDEAILGICIKADATGNDIGAAAYVDSSLIFVDPTIYQYDS